eukprot:evm.model.scf_103EXC.13 EVM.evm.TU.scf_103EXC.13   scf_103EXC:150759-151076(-)
MPFAAAACSLVFGGGRLKDRLTTEELVNFSKILAVLIGCCISTFCGGMGSMVFVFSWLPIPHLMSYIPLLEFCELIDYLSLEDRRVCIQNTQYVSSQFGQQQRWR